MENTEKILKILKSNTAAIDSLKNEYDLCVYVLHLATVEYEWTCIGTSETTIATKVSSSSGTSKTSLPKDWNASSDVYTLVYAYDHDPAITAVIKCLRIGQTLLVNAMLLHSQNKIYTLDIEIPQLIKQSNYKLLTDIKDAFSHLDQLLATYERSILANITPQRKSKLQEDVAIEKDRSYNVEHSRSVNQPPELHNPLLMVGGGGRGGYGGGLDGGGGGFGGGFSTGDHDLNPQGLPHIPNMVGGGYRPQFPGSGNMIGPNHPGFGRVHFPYGNDNSSGLPFSERLPPGAVPPGARFDPFGPPSGRPTGASHRFFGDEMPPPGFGDYYS